VKTPYAAGLLMQGEAFVCPESLPQKRDTKKADTEKSVSAF
jgi:hypothetical protein